MRSLSLTHTHTYTHTHKQTKLLPNPQSNSYTYVHAHTCTYWSVTGMHTCMEPRWTKTWNCWASTHTQKYNFIAKWPSTHKEYILKRPQRKTGTNARFTTLHHNNGKRECWSWGNTSFFLKAKVHQSAFPWPHQCFPLNNGSPDTTISTSLHSLDTSHACAVTMMWRNVSFVYNIELQFTGNVVTQSMDLGDVDNDGVT